MVHIQTFGHIPSLLFYLGRYFFSALTFSLTFSCIYLPMSQKGSKFAPQFERMHKRSDSLAQQVEHNTFNVGVLGSSPKRITRRNKNQPQHPLSKHSVKRNHTEIFIFLLKSFAI